VRQHFYTEDALDLCDVLGSYVLGGMVKLDEVTKILGLPGKPRGIDGSRVEEMVGAGQTPGLLGLQEGSQPAPMWAGWAKRPALIAPNHDQPRFSASINRQRRRTHFSGGKISCTQT
jgi:hypothetical protein